MSKETRWPSERVRRPDASTAEAWTNTSLPPPSGAIKPNPLVVLKNFTVPIVISESRIIEFRTRNIRGRTRKERHQVYEVFRLVRHATKRVATTGASSAGDVRT